MPSRKIEDCVQVLQQAWVDASHTYAVFYPDAPQPFLTCTHRTEAEQLELYAQGRTKPGKIVTNAKGGQSYHNYGLAIDIVLLVDRDKNGSFETASWDAKTDFDGDGKADWIEVVAIFKRHGWEWGGDWRFVDQPHFQKTFGFSIVQLRKMHNENKVDQNGFVKI